ncbi:hypothetical protein DFH07DRAFT_969967 [Mycena maculata]|uniref:Uncharacterized protein n=1 Tax=Mycena maculata TaxID=230809 RepID=A0AAD7HVE6_9AGAR|nr:hypothetical protein DFH07DRAFT_969967 [Mycena maculata]
MALVHLPASKTVPRILILIQIRYDVPWLNPKNIIACLEPATALLTEINDAFGTPFIQAISNTTLSLANLIKTVKKNKDECVKLMEHIHSILFSIMDLLVKSETMGSPPPTTLEHVGKFME